MTTPLTPDSQRRTERTPGPWTLSTHTGRVVMSGETRICEANVPNAALIVEAVNSHRALLAENGRLLNALNAVSTWLSASQSSAYTMDEIKAVVNAALTPSATTAKEGEGAT